ncbi:PLP-dependent aminotransferase family protein [Streptomyces sp. H10-C2]|uniref:MocR-like pyridoxine biosynthesis transcription factor PdxR n=1 Tax=unclassified Streptomyces TaxID=2593676 RepID=UPI0024BA51F6|nr:MULTISPECIES: PLP-dependent aminotransferase family protein [unclassified Streptomyces]MDJ0340543.1 PLP-dependent aminotransferase family protein [Streptomyces sp. PH10-H1]MDJ0370191.1 PLP-dependent aminotransferase family protein [Streptomyces sp. H10-C2]
MNDWAISGVDLHLDLTAGTGARAGLERALREAVRDGRLVAGTRLPSSRALAKDLGLARNTVADGYGQLVAEGWLTARQGSGTRVAGSAPPPRRARCRAAPEQAGPLGGPAAVGDHAYDLRPGTPDLSAFPRTAWLTAARRALATAPNEAFGYADPRGRPELRQALAEYLARVRGVRTDPELILVCSGFVQGTGLLARALRARGARRIGVEALGFPDTRRILRTAGLTTVPLPVDEGGARLDGLGPHPRPAAEAVLLTPAHQFPTGAPLSPERRTAVVEWARATGGIVIEDDYDGEFRYDRQPVGALQGLAPGQVVYAGTASKSLAPGVRLAWLVLPPQLLDGVMSEKRTADRHSPVMDQLTLAELIRSGAYDRHVRRMRLHYRRRRDRLVAALAVHAPQVRVSGIAAGLHAVLELPPGSPPTGELVARASRAGLALAGLDAYDGAADGPGALVVGYGTPPEHAFTGALDALCALLDGG